VPTLGPANRFTLSVTREPANRRSGEYRGCHV
jgi:hypothetical protein